MRRPTFTLLVVVALAGIGCGSGKPTTTAPPSPSAAPNPGGAPQATSGTLGGCEDDLAAGVGFAGFADDGKPGVFVFEAQVEDPGKVSPTLAKEAQSPTTAKDLSHPISRKLALELGASADERDVAIYADSGTPTCIGHPGEFYAVLRHEAWYSPYVEIERRVEGCEPPREAAPFPAVLRVARSRARGKCRLARTKTIASETFRWPSGESLETLPPGIEEGILGREFEAVVPQAPCFRPDCMRGYLLRGIELDAGPSFFELTMSRVRLSPKKAFCAVPKAIRCQDYSSLLMRPRRGEAIQPWAGTDLDSVLYDERGAKLVLSLGSARTLVVYKVGMSGPPTQAQTIAWGIGHVEESDFDPHSFCPFCGL